MRKNIHVLPIWNAITAMVSIVVLFVSICLSFHALQKQDTRISQNEINLILSAEKNELQNSMLTKQYKESKHPVLVTDLEGKIQYASPLILKQMSVTMGEHISIDEMLSQSTHFLHLFPECEKATYFLTNQNTKVFALFLVKTEECSKESVISKTSKAMIPIFCGAIIVCMIIAIRSFFFQNYILRTVKGICKSAKAIVRGDYDVEILENYRTTIRGDEIGDLVYSFAMMRDEVKEKQIREQKMHKTSQELISCVSHDLKTPISTIKAYAEGMRDGICQTKEDQKRYVNVMINKTDLLVEMIQELLDYSNAQLNELSIIKKEQYLLPYLTEVTEEIRNYVEQENVIWETILPERECVVLMDTKRITQVLYNLVENSLKYKCKKNSELHFHVYYEEDTVVIELSDNGIGIEEADIPYVFDRFYRGEKSRSSKIPGSGLGLSICQHIIRNHGGEITCVSRKDQGTKMTFTIPMK